MEEMDGAALDEGAFGAFIPIRGGREGFGIVVGVGGFRHGCKDAGMAWLVTVSDGHSF